MLGNNLYDLSQGAYYYYGWHQTSEYSNYQEALLGVHAYAETEKIPYKHVLLDSWWYTKGAAAGVKEWDATNSTFPDVSHLHVLLLALRSLLQGF